MARRTKEDALATRHQLLDAAECVFAEKGVAHLAQRHRAGGRRQPGRDLLAFQEQGRPVQRHDGARPPADGAGPCSRSDTSPARMRWPNCGAPRSPTPCTASRTTSAPGACSRSPRSGRICRDELMAVRARHRRVQADNMLQMERSLQAALDHCGAVLAAGGHCRPGLYARCWSG